MILLGHGGLTVDLGLVKVSIRSLAMILLGLAMGATGPSKIVSIRSLAMILLGRPHSSRRIVCLRFQFALWR